MDKVLMFETCDNSIIEHEGWRFKQSADGTYKGNEPYEDARNHTCDALKELLAEEPSYTPVMFTVRDRRVVRNKNAKRS